VNTAFIYEQKYTEIKSSFAVTSKQKAKVTKKIQQIDTLMSKISTKIGKVREIYPVGKNKPTAVCRSCTEKCTEADSFMARAYLCTEMNMNRNCLLFVPNASRQNWVRKRCHKNDMGQNGGQRRSDK